MAGLVYIAGAAMTVSGMKIVTDRFSQVMKGVKDIADQRVLVGIPADKTDRRSSDDGITNAAIGYIAENGAPEANIPARPWLVPTVKAEQTNIVTMLAKSGRDALAGKDTAKTLNALGLHVKQEAQKRVNEGIPPPPAESTLAARARKGIRSAKALVVTGQFRNAINYVIRKKGR